MLTKIKPTEQTITYDNNTLLRRAKIRWDNHSYTPI